MSLEPMEKSLSDITTLRIGGWTDEFYTISSREELREFIENYPDPTETIVLGRGSNMLFPEGKVERPIITLEGDFEDHTFFEESVDAGAAVFFPELALEAARRGYSGLEWAAGVPGSVGGAVAMNAGAFGTETSEVLDEMEFVGFDGDAYVSDREDVEFDYRYCELREKGLLVKARFDLEPDESSEVMDRTKKLLRERREEQPVGTSSAGCVFKNVNGDSAGRLIDEAGMKGAEEGDIKVSEDHANYFVNMGSGTYNDMLTLIERVKNSVREQFDKELETELRIVREN